ncbi:uncharacterized protein Z518_02605 [Rhinocladiella mackenziei CBS 650.93]|uniref:RanBD1 domain-containing protein n=1 Tax=Rhinocladiella mackenziei CBS 650.93 TaxID=1442369 RepID=A0A0D2IX88_9EURO|nr:uncharacterized protein Z518_02605 [Rhinocladiella mackenziei CBS 650.93]KIX07951.1 hypothetical protein Z518_02605 [Rhinocladiella mackenziei CBS 650.93]
MPKRVADEYITKENGSIANSTYGEDKPKMSTAAQLAKRRMATPKGRFNRPGTSHSSSHGGNTSSIFGQTTQQQAFGDMNGGITFGASQSFPPGTNASFTFQPPQSSSFTFGAPSTTPNPFASLNGTGNTTSNQQQDVSMESPQKKPIFGSAFGANNMDNTSSGFTFGQPVQQPSSGAFGMNESSNMNGGGLFGRLSKPEDSSGPNSIFGQPSQPQTSPSLPSFGGFGQAVSAPQTQASTFIFGQNSNANGAFTTSTPATGFNFGQNTSVPQNPLPSFGSGQGTTSQPEAPKFAFGQTSTVTPGQPSGPSFGTSAPTSQNNGGWFGSSTTTTTTTQTPTVGFGTATTASPFLFGQTQPSPTSHNPFAGLGASKSEETKGFTPLFGSSTSGPQAPTESQPGNVSSEKPATSSSEPSTETPKNLFSSLFAGATNTSQTSMVSKPAFDFGQTTQPTATTADTSEPKPAEVKPSSEFSLGTKPANPPESSNIQRTPISMPAVEKVDEESTQSKETNDTTTKPLFGFPAPSQPDSSGGLFSPANATTESNQTTGGLFGKASGGSEIPAKPAFAFGAPLQPTPDGTTQPKEMAPSLFSSTPKATSQVGDKTPEVSTPQPPSAASWFGGLSRPETKQPPSTRNAAPPSTSSATAPASVINLPTSKPDLLGTASDKQPPGSSEMTKVASDLPPVKCPIYTKGPQIIPGHLDAGKFREYDRNYRLHALNRGLQAQLASLDASQHDFENVIRHYVSARDGIGASLGLYMRSAAGTKRKGDRIDDEDEESTLNKRTRSETTQQTSAAKSQRVSASFSTSSTVQESASPAIRNSTPSRAKNLLTNMIPESKSDATVGQAATEPKPTPNPFVGLASDSNATSNQFARFEKDTISAPPDSTTPTKSPPKKLAFEAPRLGADGTNFMSTFGQKAKENADKFAKTLIEKRKAEDFDSDEDDEEAFRKRTEEEMRAKRAKIDAIAKSGGFTPTVASGSGTTSSKPTFSLGSTSIAPKNDKDTSTHTSSGFMKAASANPVVPPSSKGTSVEESEVAGDDEGSESNNDQAEGDEDEDSHGDGDDEEGEDDLQEDEVLEENGDEDDSDDNDLQAAMDRARKNPNAGKSLFDRIEPNPNMKEKTASTPTDGDQQEPAADSSPIMQPAKNSSFPPSIWGSHIGKSTPEAPSFSPITPATGASKSPYKPATTFNFTPSAPATTPTPTPGASIFAGGLTKDGPVPGEGMFGSRPSTPSNAEKNTSSLSKSILNSPPGTDNTWKEGAPISFGNAEKPTSAPTFKFTAASPGEKESSTPKPFGSLFGTSAAGSKGSEASNHLGFQFGAPTSTPAPGFLGAVSHLGGGSVTNSAVSSRATSPGLTDNESVATNDTGNETTNDDEAKDPQTSLMDSRAGEENETCLWESRSKALMYVNKETAKGTKLTPNDWNSMGVGQIRVLKDNTTGKTRVVFRVEPSATILINSHLVDSVQYESVPSTKSGAVRGALFYKGNLTRWVFKVKSPELAIELAKVMDDNKSA